MTNNNPDMKEQIRLIKQMEEDVKELRSYQVADAYRRVEVRINRNENRKIWLRNITQYAAIFSVPLLLATLTLGYLYYNRIMTDNLLTYQEVVSAPGVITQIELPDQSKVWLNADTRLKYPTRFTGKKRTVYLEGEGFFEVTSDKQNPFYVETAQNLKVMAYGTQFNVSAYEDDTFVETSLVEGAVDWIFPNQSFTIRPDETAYYDISDNKMNITKVNIEDKISWRNGKLIFRNSSIEEVIKKLSRKYNINIILHKETEIDYKFRASFTTETITQIMNYLKLAAPIEWQLSDSVQEEDMSYPKQRIDIWLR